MKKLLVFFCVCSLFSCRKEEKPHLYSFYYWKTTLELNKEEEQFLQAATADKLYVRFFDVDKKNGKFQPIAIATTKKNFATKKEIVPVVFITNRVFYSIKNKEIPFLAEKIAKLVYRKIEQFGFQSIKEIQIDCDWTRGTQKDYFQFLKELQNIVQQEVTVTLRLHQVKFKEQTGIPPVKKVYLMCYSTSSPLENSNRNSILDTKVLKNYLAKVEDYPIKNMEVALPIYSWGIIENHLGKHKLISGLSLLDLENTNFKKLSENEVEILKDGFYFGFFLNKGFKIKIEEVSEEKLDEVVDFLDEKIEDYAVVYYQLNAKFVKNRKLGR